MNDSTLYYYNKALDTALQYGDESWIAHICNNVSILYFNIRQLDEAEKYTDMAAEHAARTEDPFVAFTTWQIRATIKAELNKLDDAENPTAKPGTLPATERETKTYGRYAACPAC